MTNTAAPPVLLRLIFYREFGWTPQELDAVPLPHLLELLTVMQEEQKHHERQRKKTARTA